MLVKYNVIGGSRIWSGWGHCRVSVMDMLVFFRVFLFPITFIICLVFVKFVVCWGTFTGLVGP